MTKEAVSNERNTVTTYICVKDAAKAIDWYKDVFGAVETGARIEMGGKIGHAEIQIGDTRIMIADEFPEMDTRPFSFVLASDDVDKLATKAQKAGLQMTRPVEDQFYGERSGWFIDPFGVNWSIQTHIEDVDDEELVRRAKEMYGD